jgi:hypothetical protein
MSEPKWVELGYVARSVDARSLAPEVCRQLHLARGAILDAFVSPEDGVALVLCAGDMVVRSMLGRPITLPDDRAGQRMVYTERPITAPRPRSRAGDRVRMAAGDEYDPERPYEVLEVNRLRKQPRVEAQTPSVAQQPERCGVVVVLCNPKVRLPELWSVPEPSAKRWTLCEERAAPTTSRTQVFEWVRDACNGVEAAMRSIDLVVQVDASQVLHVCTGNPSLFYVTGGVHVTRLSEAACRRVFNTARMLVATQTTYERRMPAAIALLLTEDDVPEATSTAAATTVADADHK